MKLTYADKLAFMLASGPSQRALAAYIGASHQQVGRWVQGERVNTATGEVTNTPRDPLLRANINAAFSQYRKAVRAQATRDRIPYSHDAPLMFRRLRDHKGRPSLRVVADTGQVASGIVEAAMFDHIATGEYFECSVRSVIDLYTYLEEGEDTHAAARAKGGKVAERMLRSRDQLIKKIRDGHELLPIWTKRENVTPNVSPETALNRIKTKLRQRHEPHSHVPGAKLADQVMFSIKPANVQTTKPKARKAAASKRRR